MKKKLLLGLALLTSCSSLLAPSTSPGPSPSTVPVTPALTDIQVLQKLMDAPASSYPTKGWAFGYDTAILIESSAHSLPGLPCGDVKKFIQAVAVAESGLDRTEVYGEPPPLGINSVGLLQLSLVDQRNYGLDCGWKTEEDLKHPVKNLACGVLIMSKLHAKHPDENIYQAGGRYWSTLRAAKYWPKFSQSGYLRFKKALGCAEAP